MHRTVKRLPLGTCHTCIFYMLILVFLPCGSQNTSSIDIIFVVLKKKTTCSNSVVLRSSHRYDARGKLCPFASLPALQYSGESNALRWLCVGRVTRGPRYSSRSACARVSVSCTCRAVVVSCFALQQGSPRAPPPPPPSHGSRNIVLQYMHVALSACCIIELHHARDYSP